MDVAIAAKAAEEVGYDDCLYVQGSRCCCKTTLGEGPMALVWASWRLRDIGRKVILKEPDVFVRGWCLGDCVAL